MTEKSSRAGELLGERVRAVRQQRGVTQVALAERTGLPQSHISEIERGVMLPNLLTLLRVAAALPCKLSELTSVFDDQDLGRLLPK